MNHKDLITSAFEELKEIIKNQEDGSVEITPGEDRLGEILVTGTENYPVLVGAIAANYIDPNNRPERLNLTGNNEEYSAERWERLVHQALMDVVQRYQRQQPQESQESNSNTPSEQSGLDRDLMDVAGIAGSDNLNLSNESESPFVDPSDQNVVERFESSLEDLFESLNKKEFQFYFPLNIGESVRDTFLVDGVEIERVENSEVVSLFNSVDLDDIQSESKSFEDLLEQLSLHPTPYNSDWYWRCVITAPSPEEGVTSAQDIINTLLGKINYSIFYDSDILRKETLDQLLGSNLPDETVIVERPPFILVCDDNDLLIDVDIMSKEFGNPVELDQRFQSTYKELGLRKFPPSYGRSTEKTLASALQGFISATVADHPRESFFAYWRALEDLSFTDPQESNSIDVLRRTGRLCSLDNVAPLYNRLLDTRNALVHSGGSPTITARDTIILREMFLDAFPEIRELERHTLSESRDTNMNYVLKYLENSDKLKQTKSDINNNIDNLNNKIEENEQKIEAIDALESWQDMK